MSKIFQHHKKDLNDRRLLNVLTASNHPGNYVRDLPKKEECIKLIEEYKSMVNDLRWFIKSSYTDDDIESINHDIFTWMNGYPLSYIDRPESEKNNQKKSFQKPIQGYIYFIQSTKGVIKIGRTQHLDKRILNIGLQMPIKPTLIHSFQSNDIVEEEKAIHNQLHEYRLNGEWFKLPKRIIERLKEDFAA